MQSYFGTYHAELNMYKAEEDPACESNRVYG